MITLASWHVVEVVTNFIVHFQDYGDEALSIVDDGGKGGLVKLP